MKKMSKLLQTDCQLNNLVQNIPYGLAVINMDDVWHFNKPFAKVLGISKSKQIIKALQKFQRQV